MIRTYDELSRLATFFERYRYLRLGDKVGAETFGFDRWMNQIFYTSQEWRSLRNKIIIRDNGCDLGLEGYDIYGKIFIHHMNPVRKEDIANASDFLLNPNYLICVSFDTHQAIHYGDENLLAKPLAERKPNDTCPWRH